MRATLAAGLTVLVLAGSLACGGDENSAQGAPSSNRFDGERAFRDLRAQVRLGPRPTNSAANLRQTKLLARRLRQAGVEHVRIQHPYRNVVGVIPGSQPGAIVLGAHHDTKNGIPGFVGANDGASGVAILLELARSLPAKLDGPSLHLALFDAEEARGDRPFEQDGTRGSRQYVEYATDGARQGSPPIDSVKAMVLLDMVGDCDLKIPLEANSDPDLYAWIAAGAEAAGGSAEPFEGSSAPILDDHIPFLEAGVPSLDLIDFDFGPGPSPGAWWHTPEDTLDKVCPESLDAVGEALVRALPAGT